MLPHAAHAFAAIRSVAAPRLPSITACCLLAGMPRLAACLWMALTLLSTGCYLSHRISEGAPDGSTDGDAPLSDRACCIAVRCGPEGEVCSDAQECGPNGCDPFCDGARCAAACCDAEQLCIGEACVDPGSPCRDDGDGHVEILVLARQLHPHSPPVIIDPEDDPPLPDPCDRSSPPECPPFPPDSGPVHYHDWDPRYRHVHSACTDYGSSPGVLAVVSHQGEVERIVPLPITPRAAEMDAISVADLDADGVPEIVTPGLVIDADGIRCSDERLSGVGAAIGDLDGDGLLEIVTSQHAFEHDGTLARVPTAQKNNYVNLEC